MRKLTLPILMVTACVVLGADAQRTTRSGSDPAEQNPEAVTRITNDQTPPGEGTVPAEQAPQLRPAEGDAATRPEAANASQPFQLNWYSINSGGVINAASTSYKMGLSVGQSVAGAGSSPSYQVGIGFWYGATSGTPPCPIAKTGDVNLSTTLTAADIIYLVNYVFKSGPAPLPCAAAGDVNCNGAVTAADIIYLVNHVFKSGPVPCDVCTLIPATWSCP